MEKTIWKQATNLNFWENYAEWYQQWLEHCSYHEGILDFVNAVVRPEWSVLDIGAGSGVLTLPLSQKGCRVTALEPSEKMRRYLYENLRRTEKGYVEVDPRPWEVLPAEAYTNFDLMVACNSLHVAPIGFTAALRKVFRHRPKHVLIATEFVSPEIKIPLLQDDYAIEHVQVDKVKSSFAYHSVAEAVFHWSIQAGRNPSERDMEGIGSRLVLRNEHLWMEEEAWLGMYYWRSRDL